MLVIWGRYAWRRNWGYTADFCPLCRELRSFRQVRVRAVYHVWFVPVWVGRPTTLELRCPKCGVVLGEGWDGRAKRVSWDAGDPVEMLERTRPHRQGTVEARLALEERLAVGETSNREYLELLAEPFRAVDHMIAARQGVAGRSGVVDGLILGGVILTLLACPVALIQGIPAWIRVLLVAAPLASVIVAVVRVLTARGRSDRAGLRLVARALRELHPDPETLDLAIAMAGSAGCALAKRSTAEDVLALMDGEEGKRHNRRAAA